MKKNYKKILIVLLSVVALALILLRLYMVYQHSLEKVKEDIIPTDKQLTYGIMNAHKKLTGDYNQMRVEVSLKPGEVYTGYLLVKNHNSDEDYYVLNHSLFILIDKDGKELESENDVLPRVEFKENDIFVEKGDFKLVEYDLIVPEDIKLGRYKSLLRIYPLSQKMNDADVKFITAIGMKLLLDVEENPDEVEYELIVPDFHKLAMKGVYGELRFIFAILFGFGAIFFLYKAYRKK